MKTIIALWIIGGVVFNQLAIKEVAYRKENWRGKQ